MVSIFTLNGLVIVWLSFYRVILLVGMRVAIRIISYLALLLRDIFEETPTRLKGSA